MRVNAFVKGTPSAVAPPHARHSKRLEVLIPILYLKGVSTGDFAEAVTALLGKDAGARWTKQRSPAASSFEHKDSAA
jgi:hypothetical protein